MLHKGSFLLGQVEYIYNHMFILLCIWALFKTIPVMVFWNMVKNEALWYLTLTQWHFGLNNINLGSYQVGWNDTKAG